MLVRWKLAAVIVFVASFVASQAEAVDWIVNKKSCHDIELSEGDSLNIRTTGRDPYLSGTFSKPVTDRDHVLEFEYFCTSGIENFSVIAGPPIAEAARVKLPNLSIAEGWRTYSADLKNLGGSSFVKNPRVLRFDFGMQAEVRIKIRNVRLRPPNQRELDAMARANEIRNAKTEQANSIRKYLDGSCPRWIENVNVTTERILFSVRLDPSTQPNDYQLLEFRPEHNVSENGTVVSIQISELDDRKLVGWVKRFDDGYDRALSGWRLAKGDTLSTRRRPEKIPLRVDDYPKKLLKPKNQKGLSCLTRRGPRTDFVELGVGSVTVNVVLDQFLKPKDGPERERIPVEGRPVYFDRGAFRRTDDAFQFAQKHLIVASAIILIRTPNREDAFSPLVHPDANGGVYAMPDLATERGARVYAFVLRQLAERYRNHERSPGEITNWIVHNEIDFHTQWTNMGSQPRECVTETYYRSLRMTHDIAKQYNPHARVFASTTHHWNVPDDGKWQRLSPRELLLDLQRYCRMEGDFDWGVAFHPYPQSLFASVAWNDSKPTDDLNTPMITIQNLQVLGRFLQQPSMHGHHGTTRPVLLSEQGFHTDGYSDQMQANQAGSLWWTMKRVRSMPWIESFIYHRWIDHPAEGGLKLGLRTLPTQEHPAGQRKRSWFVYQAIGTKREAAVTKGLPQPD